MRVTVVVLAAVLVAGLLSVPPPAMAGDHDPDCATKELRGSWLCASETGGGNGGGGGSDGWAVWTSRIYSILETTEADAGANPSPCIMAYPDGGDLTGPEVLAHIEAAWEDYRQAREQYEEERAAYRRAERDVERAREARDDAADNLADARRARDEAAEAAADDPDDETARSRWEAAEAAVAAAEDALAEAEKQLTEAIDAVEDLPEPDAPEEPLPPCGGGVQAEADATAPEPRPDIKPGAALTGLTSYLEIDLEPADGMTDDGTFQTTLRLLGRDFVLEATPTFTVDWGDGTEPEPVGRRRGEPYPGGPEEITHTYTRAEEVDIVVEARWVATLRERGGEGVELPLDPLTTTGTYAEAHADPETGEEKLFPVQQAQAVRVR